MTISSRRALLLSTLAAVFCTSSLATAKPSAEARRLIKKRDSERYEVRTKHSSTKAGCARVHVAAPQKVVNKVVTDFRRYPKFIKKFQKAKVVGRKGNKTDVYLQVPILKGAAKIWAIVRFEKIKKVGSSYVLRGEMIKGNVKRLDAKWVVKKIDAKNTQLNLELLIVPKLPVPGSLVTGEVAYAADEAVMGSRNRAERLFKKAK